MTNNKQIDRAEFLDSALSCGACLTRKPDGSEPITINFSIEAWRKFDLLCQHEGGSMKTDNKQSKLVQALPEMPEPIGGIVGVRNTPQGTNEFWGYFSYSYKTDLKQRVYTVDQMREYAIAAIQHEALKQSLAQPAQPAKVRDEVLNRWRSRALRAEMRLCQAGVSTFNPSSMFTDAEWIALCLQNKDGSSVTVDELQAAIKSMEG